MARVGKLALVILLLLVCLPAAARISRHTRPGHGFSLRALLTQVCHGSPASRGTQRRSRKRLAQPLDPLLERERQHDGLCPATRAASAVQLILFPGLGPFRIASPHPARNCDSAFLCTLLI